MTDNDTPLTSGGLADIIAAIAGNKEIMEKVSQLTKSPTSESNGDAGSTHGSIEAALSDPELMSKLPAVIETLRPMLAAPHPTDGEHKNAEGKPSGHGAAAKRTALLCALKPYLSPRRREAIDYIDRMSKMGDLIKNIKH